jgi:hypothetical protein
MEEGGAGLLAVENWERASSSCVHPIATSRRCAMSERTARQPKYFISHLTEEDRAPNYLRKGILPPISIELDAPGGGLSGQRAYIDFDCVELILDGHRVPDTVLAAAKRLPPGDGGWFDSEGERAGFF